MRNIRQRKIDPNKPMPVVIFYSLLNTYCNASSKSSTTSTTQEQQCSTNSGSSSTTTTPSELLETTMSKLKKTNGYFFKNIENHYRNISLRLSLSDIDEMKLIMKESGLDEETLKAIRHAQEIADDQANNYTYDHTLDSDAHEDGHHSSSSNGSGSSSSRGRGLGNSRGGSGAIKHSSSSHQSDRHQQQQHPTITESVIYTPFVNIIDYDDMELPDFEITPSSLSITTASSNNNIENNYYNSSNSVRSEFLETKEKKRRRNAEQRTSRKKVKFQAPPQYIHFYEKTTQVVENEKIIYDMEDEDFEWLSIFQTKYLEEYEMCISCDNNNKMESLLARWKVPQNEKLPTPSQVLNLFDEDFFEESIDRFEKTTGFATELCSFKRAIDKFPSLGRLFFDVEIFTQQQEPSNNTHTNNGTRQRQQRQQKSNEKLLRNNRFLHSFTSGAPYHDDSDRYKFNLFNNSSSTKNAVTTTNNTTNINNNNTTTNTTTKNSLHHPPTLEKRTSSLGTTISLGNTTTRPSQSSSSNDNCRDTILCNSSSNNNNTTIITNGYHHHHNNTTIMTASSLPSQQCTNNTIIMNNCNATSTSTTTTTTNNSDTTDTTETRVLLPIQFLYEIYLFWKSKRLSRRVSNTEKQLYPNCGKPLLVDFEKEPDTNDHSHYATFRLRELPKKQTEEIHNDEVSLYKLRKLKRELLLLKDLMTKVNERESKKLDYVKLTRDILLPPSLPPIVSISSSSSIPDPSSSSSSSALISTSTTNSDKKTSSSATTTESVTQQPYYESISEEAWNEQFTQDESTGYTSMNLLHFMEILKKHNRPFFPFLLQYVKKTRGFEGDETIPEHFNTMLPKYVPGSEYNVSLSTKRDSVLFDTTVLNEDELTTNEKRMDYMIDNLLHDDIEAHNKLVEQREAAENKGTCSAEMLLSMLDEEEQDLTPSNTTQFVGPIVEVQLSEFEEKISNPNQYTGDNPTSLCNNIPYSKTSENSFV